VQSHTEALFTLTGLGVMALDAPERLVLTA
jgi:hypothetical protein